MSKENFLPFVQAAVEGKADRILDLSDQVFCFAETGFREEKSAELFCRKLTEEGFCVEQGIAGMPTAFRAKYGSGKPVIGLLAEYDALPGLGQVGGSVIKQETKGNSAGHGCGHNLLGAGVFGAALGVKKYLEEHPERGTVILFGCPSEEKGNAKTIMARDGEFDGVDAALTWHPADRNMVASYSSLANVSVYFDFKGITSHAAAAPELGRSALDAAELMSVGVNYLREHVIQEARIHYAYIDVGGNAPNVVQGSSRVHYFIRAPKTYQVLEIFERVKDIARGAALMTGTESSFEIYSGVSDCIPNRVLSGVLYNAMTEVGAPAFDEADFALAADFFHKAYPEEKVKANEAALAAEYSQERSREKAERPLDTEIAPLCWSIPPIAGSTDVGDVSHVVPTAQLSYATSALKTALHSWQATAQGNTSIAHKAVLAAGKAIALAAVRIMEEPSIADKAKEEWKTVTGGQYVCPITKEVKPRLED